MVASVDYFRSSGLILDPKLNRLKRPNFRSKRVSMRHDLTQKLSKSAGFDVELMRIRINSKKCCGKGHNLIWKICDFPQK